MKIKTISTYVAIAGLSAGLSACSTIHKIENSNTQQQTGALVGGLAGATGATLLGTGAAGAIIAAAIGAGVGYYVESPSTHYHNISLEGGNVFAQGDYLTITLSSDKLFEADSDILLPNAKNTLKSVINVLDGRSDENILITANTDNIGSKQHQYELSVKQASKIAAYLWSNGIQENNTGRKLNYSGMGSFNPVANNMSARGATQNRRITIVVYPQKHIKRSNKDVVNVPAM